MKTIFIIPLLLLTSSCLKTAEQIKREQLVDNLNQEVRVTQKNNAEVTLAIKDLQTALANLQGKIEELEHHQAEERKAKHQQEEVLKQHQSNAQTLLDEVNQLKAQVEEQKNFIKQVTETLGHMSKGSKSAKGADAGTDKKEETSDVLKTTTQLIQKKKYEEARNMLFELLEDKKLPSKVRDQVWQNLGQIELDRKNYEEALVYFTKIYPSSPKSKEAPKALFNIGKVLQKQGKKNESKMSFEELIKQYPNSSFNAQAKKELAELK